MKLKVFRIKICSYRLLLISSLPLLVLLGALYQYSSEEADKSFIPGQLVTVEKNQFHLLCRGSGSPLILLENGLWGSYPDWLYTIEGLDDTTKICAYDRLGLGWSSSNHQPTRASDVAKNLKGLLEAAGKNEPTILVGFSAGGLYVREYLHQYPENIVGMLLIDSSHEQQAFRRLDPPKDLSLEIFCDAVAWTGIARLLGLFDNYVEKSFSRVLHEDQLRSYNRTQFCSGLVMQSEGFVMDLMENRAPTDMGSLPLVVISAGKSIREQIVNDDVADDFLEDYDKVHPQLQKELALLSTNSTHLVAKNSGHAVQLESPDVVINALRNMVLEHRSKNP